MVERSFRHRFPTRHGLRDTGATSAALVVGALVWTRTAPPPALFQLVLALVAGTTLLLAFRDELPSPRDSRIGAVALGAGAVVLLQQLRWWL